MADAQVAYGFRISGVLEDVSETPGTEKNPLPTFWGRLVWMGGGVRVQLLKKRGRGEVVDIPCEVMARGGGKTGFWVREREA